jgi:hypothetical protein
MDINELLEDAKDEPSGVTVSSADGRLFFIPDSEAERFAVENSEMYERFVASRDSAPVAKVSIPLRACEGLAWFAQGERQVAEDMLGVFR